MTLPYHIGETAWAEGLRAHQAEVANYERILSNYYGRWYDQGKRHLAGLRQGWVDAMVQALHRTRVDVPWVTLCEQIEAGALAAAPPSSALVHSLLTFHGGAPEALTLWQKLAARPEGPAWLRETYLNDPDRPLPWPEVYWQVRDYPEDPMGLALGWVDAFMALGYTLDAPREVGPTSALLPWFVLNQAMDGDRLGTPWLHALHQRGIDVAVRDSETGRSLVEWAVCYNETSCPEMLCLGLAAGLPVDHRDAEGWTPLQRWCAEPHEDDASDVSVLTQLLAAGASVQVTNPDGDTPLHAVLSHELEERQAVCQALLDAGASMWAQNAQGQTPLDLAQASRVSDAFWAFLQAHAQEQALAQTLQGDTGPQRRKPRL